MKLFAKGVWLAMLAAMSLTSCGGGGSAIQGGVFILAGVEIKQSAYAATVYVNTDNFGGAPIMDATVKVNSQTLTYDVAHTYYVGTVLPDSAGKFNLSVTAKGATYTAAVDAFTSMPVLHVPSFTANAANTITWTPLGGAPAPSNNMFYFLWIDDAASVIVYTSNMVTATSVTVPAKTTLAGTNYNVTLFGAHQVSIANAATSSTFSMQANALPVNFTAQ